MLCIEHSQREALLREEVYKRQNEPLQDKWYGYDDSLVADILSEVSGIPLHILRMGIGD
jgi:hypothetical protein